MRNRKTKLYEFYFKAGEDITGLCKIATVDDVAHDDDALDGLAVGSGVSGWNYVVCGQIGMYRDRKVGKFVKATDAIEFLVDRGNRKMALMVVEDAVVSSDALPRIKGYEYMVPEKVSDGSDADLDKEKEVVEDNKGGEAAPSGSGGKVEEEVKNEEVVEKKVEMGFIKADMMKMTKNELLELCMKHIDVKLWNENMRKAELVELFF